LCFFGANFGARGILPRTQQLKNLDILSLTGVGGLHGDQVPDAW
jgi:hypothetical protein